MRPCWRRDVLDSDVRRMNEVNPHRARLVLGWAIVVGRYVYHLGISSSFITPHGQPTHTHTTAYNHIHQHTQNYILRSIKTQKKTITNQLRQLSLASLRGR